MRPDNPAPPRVVVASDDVTDANVVRDILAREGFSVFTAADGAQIVDDFDSAPPAVLVLAFDTLDKAQSCYLGICRHSTTIHRHVHRTILMCSQAEVRPAYDLCRRRLFDDYVLFWPVTHDAWRLPMAVHNGVREIEADVLRREAPGADAPADRLADRLAEEPACAVPDATADAVAPEIRHHQHIAPGFEIIAPSIAPARASVAELDVATRPHREPSRAPGLPAQRPRPVVLVVDDDPLQRHLIAHILGAERYRIEFAHDGMKALIIARNVSLDLVLMDVMMPGMGGMEAVRHLRAYPALARVPIVMMTGKSVGDVVVDSMQAGATDFVVKPLDRKVLLAKVAAAFCRTATSSAA